MQNVIDALKKKIKRRDQKIVKLQYDLFRAKSTCDAAMLACDEAKHSREFWFNQHSLTHHELDDLKREWIARTKHDGRIITGFAIGVAAWAVL